MYLRTRVQDAREGAFVCPKLDFTAAVIEFRVPARVETHKTNVEGRARLLRVIGFYRLARDGPIVRYRDVHLGKCTALIFN